MSGDVPEFWRCPDCNGVCSPAEWCCWRCGAGYPEDEDEDR